MTYSTREVMQKAKVSARELQWWDEQGVLPSVIVQSKHSRQFTPLQLVQMAIVKEMRRHGIALSKIRYALRTKGLGRVIAGSLPDENGFYSKSQDFYMLTNGNRLYRIAQSPEDVVSYLRYAKGPMHCLSIHTIVQQVLPTTQAIVDTFNMATRKLHEAEK